MMLKRYVWGAGVLAVLAVLLLPQVSEAQRRGRLGRGYRDGYGYGYAYRGYGGFYGYAPGYGGFGYGGPNYALAPGVNPSYQSFYPPTTGTQGSSNETRIKVLLPDPSARVIIDGNPTRQTGTEREFVTELQPGTSGTYQITARWTENGETREVTRDVPVRPGQWQVVDFNRPQTGGNTNTGGRQTTPPRKGGSSEDPLP
jgi:uncharacterized protein (TIGR03000 family)